MALEGLTVPVPTLFGPAGELDPGRNARLARRLSEAGVDHLFVLGSLGEFPSITHRERRALLESVIESVTGRTDVWAGVGAPSTPMAVARAEEAEAAGAAALVAVPPFYLRPTIEAVGRYYEALGRASGVPVLAYNIPSLVGYALPAASVRQWAAAGWIEGIKDTSGSLDSVRGFLAERPPGFAVFPGDDALVSQAIAEGASGGVMGLANIAPRLAVELVRAARAGDRATASARQALVDTLGEVTRAGPFPSTVKFLMAELGGVEVGYRAPYDPLSAEESRRVLDRLQPLRAALAPYVPG